MEPYLHTVRLDVVKVSLCRASLTLQHREELFLGKMMADLAAYICIPFIDHINELNKQLSELI